MIRILMGPRGALFLRAVGDRTWSGCCRVLGGRCFLERQGAGYDQDTDGS